MFNIAAMPTNNEEAGKRALIELQAELVERVQGLNSLFVTAGYGTFFGIWAIAKDDISAFARLWSVLFLLLSATIFVGWHVVGLIATNRAVWNQIEETEPTKRAAKIRRGVANGTLKLARH
ncbi:MAG TPA: hypothetical protein VGT79_00870, partial [Xanthomonadaceae bacterium]|nr:hypothetical protein [Xanthomonadaceae bacterium]